METPCGGGSDSGGGGGADQCHSIATWVCSLQDDLGKRECIREWPEGRRRAGEAIHTSSDSGYAQILNPISSSSAGVRMGVEPPSSMLAIFGTCGATLQNARISSRERRASMNRMSAPWEYSGQPTRSARRPRFQWEHEARVKQGMQAAREYDLWNWERGRAWSAKAAARHSASSIEFVLRESERAAMRMFAPSSRASTAARMRETASSRETTCVRIKMGGERELR